MTLSSSRNSLHLLPWNPRHSHSAKQASNMTLLLFLPSVFIVLAISYWLPRDTVNLLISFAIAIFVLRLSDNNVFLHPTFVVPAMCYWLRSISLSVFLSFALAILELRPDDNKAINKVTPNADQTKAISPSPTTDPDTEILATDKQTTDGDQTQDILDSDSTSGKTACMDLVFWPTLFLPILPCRADIELISPTTQSPPTKSALPFQSTEPALPSTGFDFFLPKHISSVSESINWNFGSLARQSKRASFMPASCLPVDTLAEFAPALPSTEPVLPSTSFDFVLPRHISSVSESKNWNFDTPARRSKRTSFMPASCLAVNIPAEFASQEFFARFRLLEHHNLRTQNVSRRQNVRIFLFLPKLLRRSHYPHHAWILQSPSSYRT